MERAHKEHIMQTEATPSPKEIAMRRAVETHSIHTLRRAYINTDKHDHIEVVVLAQVERDRAEYEHCHASGRD